MNFDAAKRRTALTALISGADITLAKPPTLLPASDYFDLAGEEFGARLLLTTGADGTSYCLRPDFTLPIAKTYIEQETSGPAAFAYLGPVFRQRASGPSEFEQAGIELLAQPDPDLALHRVFDFTREALAIFGISAPAIRLGSVALFEALLDAAEMPAVWRPRLRRRFGSPKAMGALLDRLADPHSDIDGQGTSSREQLIADITERMHQDGLSLVESRRPEEIADRFLEKQALAAAHVPEKTIALLRSYLAISGPSGEAFQQIQNLFTSHDLPLSEQMESLEHHCETLATYLPDAGLNFETGFSPRLHYYTGLVFEMTGPSGSILASGGQYDRLLMALGANEQVAASGCAVWVDRLEREAIQ